MTSVSDPLVGHVLDRRYRITERLARGGMATVYRGVDERLGRTVAIKVMHVGLGDDAEFSRKFDREARAAAKLSHANVVSVFDQGRDVGRPYIVMEYVAGMTLRDVICRDTPMDPIRALDLIEPVVQALASAHDAGLIHRDVKPENVLISDRGQIKVADFGLAKAITAQTSTATAGLLIGTVSYLPPELVISGKADARSDVYSTGVVLFELLTGRKPHTGETPIQVAYAHVHNDVPPPSTWVPAGTIPPYLDALVGSFTARDRDVRPPDAKVMLTQLRRVRSALAEGLADDPDLTQDLTVALSGMPFAGSEQSEPAPENLEHTTEIADYSFTPAVPKAFGPVQPEATPRTPSSPVDPSWSHPISVQRAVAPQLQASAPENTGQVPIQYARASEHQRRQRRTRRAGWIALILVLLLTAVAVLAGWYVTKGRFTTTPALSTMTQDQAMTAAREAGVFVVFTEEFSETVKRGRVISTSPKPGDDILLGGEIKATVSKGPERYPAPKLVGLTQEEATDALAEANLVPGKISQEYDAKISRGVVMEASVEEGAKLKPQASVDLTVSDGPKPIKITDFSGQPASEAEASLKDDGFKVTVSEQSSDTVAAGLVISQDPSGGRGKKGDTINLIKSKGPVMVTVPQVKAMGVEAAKAEVLNAGFKVATEQAVDNYLGIGYVAYTDPAAGSMAPKGSVITLYLI